MSTPCDRNGQPLNYFFVERKIGVKQPLLCMVF